MPFDQIQSYDLVGSKADRIYYLADFIELQVAEKDLKMCKVHCGASHCAYGWAETLPALRALGLPLHPGTSFTEENYEAAHEFFGLNSTQWSYCFGAGIQFNYMNLRHKKADVVRHLRETARDVAKEEHAVA